MGTRLGSFRPNARCVGERERGSARGGESCRSSRMDTDRANDLGRATGDQVAAVSGARDVMARCLPSELLAPLARALAVTLVIPCAITVHWQGHWSSWRFSREDRAAGDALEAVPRQRQGRTERM